MTFFGIDRSMGPPVQIDMEAFLRALSDAAAKARAHGNGARTRFAPFRRKKAKRRNPEDSQREVALEAK